VTTAEPNWSPTWFSRCQADVTALRQDWSDDANTLMVVGGISASTGYQHYQMGGTSVASGGYEVIMPMGYDRTGLAHTPGGFDSSPADEHCVLSAPMR